MAPDTGELVAAILNDFWMVRHYNRGGQSSILKKERERAIRKLGLTVRAAFNESEDFEALLTAVLDGASPHEYHPRF